jgi:hypothetical protein
MEEASNPAILLENPEDCALTNQVIEPSKFTGQPP